MRFVLATNNQGKLREMRAILADLGADLLSMAEAGLSMEIEETGHTFEENALIKARAVFGACGLPAVADDSGLAVDALGGAPGVYSARYAGAGAGDAAKIEKLLCAMKDVPEGARGAEFVSCVACVLSERGEFTVRGVCRGEILTAPRGDGGFGYDPVFYVREYGGTFAQLPAELKNTISHRARALRALRERLALPGPGKGSLC